MTSRLTKWTGIGGVLFFVALAAAILGEPSTPDDNASAAKVVRFYHNHKAAVNVNNYVTEIAVVIALAFFWYLRQYVASVPANRRLAGLGYAGAVLLAASGALSAGFAEVAVDGVNHFDPGSLQLTNALVEDSTNYLGGIGAAVLLITTGIAAIRTRVLPPWLGWIGIVFGVGSLVIAIIGLAGIGLWSLITGIVLIVRSNQTPPVVTPAPADTTAAVTP